MKRIALIFIGVMSLLMACEHKVPEPEIDIPGGTPDGKNRLSLNIHIPNNSASTYANENASPYENYIDLLFIVLYQGSVAIDTTTFSRADETNPNKTFKIVSDSIIEVGYEVDNITTGALNVQVFANRLNPSTLGSNTEIPIPLGDGPTSFYMSGETTSQLTNTGTAYFGEVHLIRNVAKLRINVSLNSIFIPGDLDIDYNGIVVEVTKTPNTTSKFNNSAALDLAPGDYISYPPRTIPGTGPTNLRRSDTKFESGNSDKMLNGGQIDSLYLYENKRTSFDLTKPSANKTQIKITIPTTSPTEGNKSSSYTYDLSTILIASTSFNILRNYIYTLNIKVRGQNLDPLITLELLPWNDVLLDGSILGTYLTTDISEIIFSSNGYANIDFCTDAQAVYFDFSNFNNNNSNKIDFSSSASITPDYIEPADPFLAPAGFTDGQILLDKRHCGSFGFSLKLSDFPGFPNVDFSGSICMKAGNIVKCFTFPGINKYDAHYIVGEPLFNNEPFTSATAVQQTGGTSPVWLQVSTSRLYTGATQNYSGSALPLYLHLDENLTGNIRTGYITLTNTSGSKKINISQLPAVKVGRFGYTAAVATDDSIYNSGLYMEQLHEFGTTKPVYLFSSGSPVSYVNALYNGRVSAISAFDWTQYGTNPYFNYQNTLYQAINYCAQKNRISGTSALNNELKWYLPSQAQLMGMWLTANRSDSTNSDFKKGNDKADFFWSSTDNKLYSNEAQYVNLIYGNAGHYFKTTPYWARCVRNDPAAVNSMVWVYGSPQAVALRFYSSYGMPEGSFTSASKSDPTTEAANRTLYGGSNIGLRVALNDAQSSASVWSSSACSGYVENGVTSWRLPTQRELQAIWILQSEMKSSLNAFNLLANDYYWSATSAPSAFPNNAWVVYGSRSRATPGDSGNAPHRNKNERSRVRCVKEVNL